MFAAQQAKYGMHTVQVVGEGSGCIAALADRAHHTSSNPDPDPYSCLACLPSPAGVARARHHPGGEAAPSGGGARELTVGAWMGAGQVNGVGGALWVHESSRWVPRWRRGRCRG